MQLVSNIIYSRPLITRCSRKERSQLTAHIYQLNLLFSHRFEELKVESDWLFWVMHKRTTADGAYKYSCHSPFYRSTPLFCSPARALEAVMYFWIQGIMLFSPEMCHFMDWRIIKSKHCNMDLCKLQHKAHTGLSA